MRLPTLISEERDRVLFRVSAAIGACLDRHERPLPKRCNAPDGRTPYSSSRSVFQCKRPVDVHQTLTFSVPFVQSLHVRTANLTNPNTNRLLLVLNPWE